MTSLDDAKLRSLGWSPKKLFNKEIKRIVETIEIAPATPVVNFNLKYNIEKIPTPDMNKIYSLTTVESNVWDKPVFDRNTDTNELQETHVLKNLSLIHI